MALVVAARVDHHVRRHGIPSAEEAPSRSHRPVEPEVETRGRLELVVAIDAAAAAEATGAPRVGPEPVAADKRGVTLLEHLHGEVLEAAVDVVDEAVLADAALERAPA